MVMLTYDILVRGVTFFFVDGGRPRAVGVVGPTPVAKSFASSTSVRTPGGQYFNFVSGFGGEAARLMKGEVDPDDILSRTLLLEIPTPLKSRFNLFRCASIASSEASSSDPASSALRFNGLVCLVRSITLVNGIDQKHSSGHNCWRLLTQQTGPELRSFLNL